MKTILALLLAGSLSACQTPGLNRACDTAFSAARTAQDIIALLVRDWHLSPEKAAQWADAILKGQAGIALFCAAVPAPVAVPGQ